MPPPQHSPRPGLGAWHSRSPEVSADTSMHRVCKHTANAILLAAINISKLRMHKRNRKWTVIYCRSFHTAAPLRPLLTSLLPTSCMCPPVVPVVTMTCPSGFQMMGKKGRAVFFIMFSNCTLQFSRPEPHFRWRTARCQRPRALSLPRTDVLPQHTATLQHCHPSRLPAEP